MANFLWIYSDTRIAKYGRKLKVYFYFCHIHANLSSLHILSSIHISINTKDALLVILSNVCFIM
jgi:hypothetical protein